MERKTIAVIGGGFCGLATVLQLKKQLKDASDIILINAGSKVAKGIAYSTDSEKLVLNVPAGKMSLFPDQSDHFLNWLHLRQPYHNIDKELLAKMFVARKEYGSYLESLYNELVSTTAGSNIKIIEDYADDIEIVGDRYLIKCRTQGNLNANFIVLATGNELPRNPKITEESFYSSSNYFHNPWNEQAVTSINKDTDIFILGNGLTMVDTVLGLIENGCTETIYSLSPNGFNILPHRHGGVVYTKLVEEIEDNISLKTLFNLFHKHTKILRHFGLSAEPIVDSIRPYSQKIWQNFDIDDKKKFLNRVRHLWGVARHRLPIHIYDFIQQLRIERRLVIMKGNLIAVNEINKDVFVTYFDGKKKEEKPIKVSRVINCTGPSLDITQSDNPLISALVRKGMIRPDALHLGIDCNADGTVINTDQKNSQTLFTIGGSMRGLLWESTAVPELRVQAAALAGIISSKIIQQ